jgi:hypothetical protein
MVKSKDRTSRDEHIVSRKECYDLIVHALDLRISIPIQGIFSQKILLEGLAGMAASNQSIHFDPSYPGKKPL